MDIWDMIANQRCQLADVFDGLDASQWTTPSLCEGWTIRDIAGHLISPQELGMTKMLLHFAGSGFNFDKMVDKVARQFAQRPTSELVRLLRTHAESRWTPPGLGPEAPLWGTPGAICRGLGKAPGLHRDQARCLLRATSALQPPGSDPSHRSRLKSRPYASAAATRWRS